jgi:hypothetical protein
MDYQTIPEQTEPELIARWESRGGKYWIDLYFNPCFHLAKRLDDQGGEADVPPIKCDCCGRMVERSHRCEYPLT